MAIKIQTKQTTIPVEIGENKFEFDASDKNIQRFYNEAKKMEQKMQGMKGVEGNSEEAKKILKEGFDMILGEGVFDKIFAEVPSSIVLTNIFMQLGEGIAEEIEALGATQTQKQKAEKYLTKKRKK